MAMISYAQNFEDVMLWRALKGVENGFYIDVGAQDPIIDSVSLAFHEHGWTGIHVEPTPHYAQLLREQRPGDVVLEVAIGMGQNLISFFEIPDSGISTASAEVAEQHRERGFNVREITVPCVKLSSVFEACRGQEIHWMKVDVEGLECEVLKSWGKAKNKPWIVVVESTLPLTQIESHKEWEMLLTKRGYLPVYFDGLNRFYLAIERVDLKKAFDSPPNLFDGFVLTRNSWPWGANLKTEILQAEQKLDAEKEASAVRHLAQDADFKAMLENHRAEAAQQLHETLSLKNDLTARVNSVELEAFNAFRVHASDREALQSDIARVSADLVRLNTVLAAKEAAYSSLLLDREQERITFSQEIAKKESEFGSTISQCQFEIDRINQLLTLKLNEIEVLQQAHNSKLLHIVAESGLRENNLSIKMLTMQQLAEKEKTELIMDRDERMRLVVDQLQKREIAFGEVQALLQQELTAALHTTSRREQEFVTQMLAIHAQADAHRIEQNRLHDDQIRRQAGEHLEREKMHMELVQSLQIKLRAVEAERRKMELLVVEQRDASLQLQEQLLRELSSQSHLAEQFKSRLVIAESEAQLMRESFSWRITSPIRTLFGKRFLPAPVVTSLSKISNEAALQHTSIAPPRMKTNMTSTSSATRLPDSIVEEILSYEGNVFIEHAFQTLLGRPPEHEALIHYLNRMQTGISKEQIVTEITVSKEGQQFLKLIQGLVRREEKRAHAAASVSELLSHHDEAFVNCMYQTILGRDADPDGLTYYLAKLRNGAEKMQLAAEVLSSGESERKRKLFGDLSNAIDPKKQTKLLSRELLSVASIVDTATSIAKIDVMSVETDTLEAFFACGDGRFIRSIYLTLLGRATDQQGEKFYKDRLAAGVPRVQLISEVIQSDECKRRQAFFKQLDSVIGLAQSANDTASDGSESRIVTTISAWPLVGWFVRVAVVVNRLARRNNRHVVTKEEMPQLVQQHLDFDRLHNRSELAKVSDLMWKYSVLDQRLTSVVTRQFPTLVDALNELRRKQDAIESVVLPKLLEQLSELNHHRHIHETVHLPNLLQTISDINHRQMAADHAKDNLIKTVPVALRKITRDLDDLMSHANAVAKH